MLQVQQSSRAPEVTPFLDLPTRVTFANDPSGAQLLRSVIGLWGTATANRAAAIGPMAALESDSVLTTAVRAVTSQAHDLSRVRFTLLLPEFAGSLATEEEEAALGQTLMSFYHAALPAANIGTPYSVDLLWAEAAAEGDVQVSHSPQPPPIPHPFPGENLHRQLGIIIASVAYVLHDMDAVPFHSMYMGST